MNNFAGSIDTDMAIGSILSNFESAWVMNTVNDSLQMRFRPFAQPMPNYVDILERQFNTLLVAGSDFKEKVQETRNESYIEIIQAICGYYHLVFTKPFEEINPVELYGIAHSIYDIFISRFTDYMIDFYIKYIINNMDSIYSYLMSDENIKKPRDKDAMAKSYIDPKFMVIHANLNKIVMNMTAYDIPLDVLLAYFVDQPTAATLSQLLVDTGDIYKNYYAVYLHDQRYMSQLLTRIKLELQARTQESFNVKDTVNI